MYISNGIICAKPYSEVMEFMRGVPIREVIIPAWSLHRLWEIQRIRDIELEAEGEIARLYDIVIDNLEKLIKEGTLNKEYLV